MSNKQEVYLVDIFSSLCPNYLRTQTCTPIVIFKGIRQSFICTHVNVKNSNKLERNKKCPSKTLKMMQWKNRKLCVLLVIILVKSSPLVCACCLKWTSWRAWDEILLVCWQKFLAHQLSSRQNTHTWDGNYHFVILSWAEATHTWLKIEDHIAATSREER